jgi:hypothetical protein
MSQVNICSQESVGNELSFSTVNDSFIPKISKKEREKYSLWLSIKLLKFSSPEEEYEWSSHQEKKCPKCDIVKPLSFYLGNTSGTDPFDKDGYRLRRPECYKCTKKINDEKNEAKKIAKLNGISYKAPEGTRCGVCDCLPSKGNGLVFDHHHEQKIFRGYCCNSCNRSMGVLGDNTLSLLKVIKYLNKTDKLTKEQILEALELE